MIAPTMNEAVSYYVTLPLKELRRRQELCHQQQRMAYEMAERREALAAKAMAELQQMEDDLATAVWHQTWGAS